MLVSADAKTCIHSGYISGIKTDLRISQASIIRKTCMSAFAVCKPCKSILNRKMFTDDLISKLKMCLDSLI